MIWFILFVLAGMGLVETCFRAGLRYHLKKFGKKSILPVFLITSSAWGQAFTPQDLPWLAQGAGIPACSLTNSFYVGSATIYGMFFADSITNWTGTTNGNSVVPGAPNTNGWLNILPNGDLLNITNTQVGNYQVPVYTNTGPNGYMAVDFEFNYTSGGAVLRSYNRANGAVITWSNQPNTIFIVALDDRDMNGAGQTQGCTLFDCFTGNREFWRIGSTTLGTMYAGTVLTVPPSANTKNWFIYSMVFNGASSYVRTNGVLYASGNVGGNSLGQMMLGTDFSQVTPYFGRMYAVLLYAGAMNTNDLILIERNLNCKANLGYTIPGP